MTANTGPLLQDVASLLHDRAMSGLEGSEYPGLGIITVVGARADEGRTTYVALASNKSFRIIAELLEMALEDARREMAKGD